MTTIKDFANAFDTSTLMVLVLMLSDTQFFSLETHKEKENTSYPNIDLSRKAVDALELMLSEKAETLEIPLDKLGQLLSVEESVLQKTIQEHKDDFIRMVKQGKIRYKAVQTLFKYLNNEKVSIMIKPEIILNAEKTTVAVKESKVSTDTKSEAMTTESTAKPEPVTPAAVKKKKKKSKYSMTTEKIAKIIPEKMPIKDIRMFLLDAGMYELKDIAFMSDEEILATYNQNFITIATAAGTLIIHKDSFVLNQAYLIES